MNYRLAAILFTCLGTFSFLGCTYTHRSTVHPVIPEVDTEPLPLKAGLYISPEFAGYEAVDTDDLQSPFVTHRFVIPVGEAGSEAIREAMPIIFQNYEQVALLPPYEPPRKDLDLVLEPQVESYRFWTPITGGMGYHGEVALRITAFALDGTPFASWVVSGLGADRGFHMSHSTPNGLVADAAIASAVQKLITGFQSQPEIQAWLQSGREAGGVEP